jgi:hypothetical protein
MTKQNEIHKIILIQTRYFNQKVFESKICDELISEPIDDLYEIVFKKLISNNKIGGGSEFFSPKTISNTKEFFIAIKEYYGSIINKKIDESFNGYLYRLNPKLNQETVKNVNVFFYHHWFDKQFKDYDKLPTTYLNIIIEKIWHILNLTKEDTFKLYLFLHAGDFDSKNEYKILSVKKSIILNNENTVIVKFHHSKGEFIWDLVLNNKNIDKELENAIKNGENIEDFILSKVLPEKIDNEFKSFIK